MQAPLPQANDEHPGAVEVEIAATPFRRARFGRIGRSDWLYPVLLSVILFAVVATTLLWRYQPGALDLQVGEVATQTVKANRTVQYVSAIKTNEARRAALEDPANIVLAQDPRIVEAQAQKLETFIAAVEAAKRDATVGPTEFRDRLASVTPPGLPAYDLDTLYRSDDPSRLRIENAARQTIRTTLTDRKIPAGSEATTQLQMIVTSADALSATESGVALDLARAYVVANMTQNVAETHARQQQALAAVPDVKVTVLENEVIVREGDLVTAEAVEKLESLGLGAPKLTVQRIIGLLGLTASLIGIVTFFLWTTMAGRLRRSQALLLLFALIVPVVFARFLLAGHAVLPYLFPIAGVSMVLVLLLNTELAMASTVFLAIFCAYFADQSLSLTAMFLISGLTGVLLAERAQATVAFLWSAAAIGIAGSLIAVSWRLLTPPVDALGIAQRVGFAFGNGILSAGAAFIGVTLLARLFGIVTPFQLLELAHPRQPLLKRLAQDAPGTYYHSMIVGNLAEKAVEEIGGDPLLTRVAVFYHDIGKALHPAYFIENQANMRNIHDTLDPYTSARIIIAHVTDGVAMAEEARLPPPIIDVIAQHHGTTRTEVFYQKAREHDGDAVDAARFRYPGPVPQTKEAAVIMLADATEAATRAANRAGRLNVDASEGANGNVEAARTAAIRTIVERIVQDRLKNGQLAEAPLTLRDLDAIQRTFVAVLDGMYHPRIDYPTPTPSTTPMPAPESPDLVAIPAGVVGEAASAPTGHAD
ncbi:MAG: HDIG domain-containing protein [Thermomicrobia bacterium]|nr:HDIG domain-containing protein [Thermomicrobia bacterium]